MSANRKIRELLAANYELRIVPAQNNDAAEGEVNAYAIAAMPTVISKRPYAQEWFVLSDDFDQAIDMIHGCCGLQEDQ